jgi:pimeloyl-ACP methyl ester carboxylesterase
MTGKIKLKDRRTLCYEEYGRPGGKPVMFFHGTPSSRLQRFPDDTVTASLGARLITIDRPGFGCSTFQPYRQLLDWPDDVITLADSLGIGKFAVAGVSGGGPYAAACAYKIPNRLTRVGMISSVGPTDIPNNLNGLYSSRKIGVFIARNFPLVLPLAIAIFQNPQHNPESYFKKILKNSSKTDQEIITRPEIKHLLISCWLEGTRNGIKGFAREGIIFSKPWGFQLEDIQTEIYIWHGDKDTSTPVIIAKNIANQIPHCHLNIIPNKGHFLLFDQWQEILAKLVNL